MEMFDDDEPMPVSITSEDTPGLRSLREAVEKEDAEQAKKVLDTGVDPFMEVQSEEFWFDSAFQKAVGRGNVRIIAQLAAAPKTDWIDRFLICKNDVVSMPCSGRGEIINQTDPFSTGGFFQQAKLTLEGLEINLMYGYKIKPWDLRCMAWHAREALEPRERGSTQQILKLALAASSLKTEDNETIDLDSNLAELADKGSFRPQSHEIAEILLRAGANPNIYWPEEHRYTPPLFGAVRQSDSAMVKLLLKYGADVNQSGRWLDESTKNWRSIPGFHVPERSGTIMECASGNAEILEILSSHAERKPTPAPVDARSYVKSLCRELTRGYESYRQSVVRCSELLVVAVMRATNSQLPVGFAIDTLTSFLLPECGLSALWGRASE